MKTKTEPKDFGTHEMGRRFSVVPKLSGHNNYSGKVVDETEIDRLLLKDAITSAEHSTLEGLLRRLHKANFVGMKSPSYDAPISADPSIVGDKRAQTIRAMVKIVDKMDRNEKIGRFKRAALINLVLMDSPWPGSNESLKEAISALNVIFTAKSKA